MTNATTPTNHQIACPNCARTLNVPPEAVGQSVSCPHCRAPFLLTPGADGGPPVPTTPPPGRKVLAVPKQLFGPALFLILFGMAGFLVNGYLSLMFAFKPGSDLELARVRVAEARTAGILAESKENANVPEDQRPERPAAGAPLSPEEEALAEAWAPNMQPIHLAAVFTSGLTLLGGICLLTGRYYGLAMLGCVASWVNADPICCIPAGLAGLWGLLMLVRDDARRHFGRPPAGPGE